MPHDLKNWTYADAVAFLEQHFFRFHSSLGSSHRYFVGNVDGVIRYVQLWYHARQAYDPRALHHNVILKSGIPQAVWIAWAKAGNRKARKRVQYPGAEAVRLGEDGGWVG